MAPAASTRARVGTHLRRQTRPPIAAGFERDNDSADEALPPKHSAEKQAKGREESDGSVAAPSREAQASASSASAAETSDKPGHDKEAADARDNIHSTSREPLSYGAANKSTHPAKKDGDSAPPREASLQASHDDASGTRSLSERESGRRRSSRGGRATEEDRHTGSRVNGGGRYGSDRGRDDGSRQRYHESHQRDAANGHVNSAPRRDDDRSTPQWNKEPGREVSSSRNRRHHDADRRAQAADGTGKPDPPSGARSRHIAGPRSDSVAAGLGSRENGHIAAGSAQPRKSGSQSSSPDQTRSVSSFLLPLDMMMTLQELTFCILRHSHSQAKTCDLCQRSYDDCMMPTRSTVLSAKQRLT